jgi:uncharacterized coiled-coil protein SlyX
MARVWNYVPRVAIFLAGIAAGALTSSRRDRNGADPEAIQELKRSLAGLESRLATQESAYTGRLSQVDARLDDHFKRLSDVPATSQIVAAMEQLLSKTMASLDDRLSTQAHSIEVLKATVSQTDSLLERVLESLDSLQSYSESSDLQAGSLLEKPIV